ncbi:MAG: LysR family transcriptional regulator [Methylovirgula sp.]|jgi:DNA-binding transcriptional LysR family regulator
MQNFEDVLAFVRVVETGGFSRAAARLGVSKSIVSRRIARLEADLGVRLLNRTTRGIAPTEAGLDFKERCVEILKQLDAAREVVACRERDVAGTLRLSVPLSFGVARLGPAIAAFAAAYPRVSIDLSFSDRFVDLVSEGFDAAIRVGVPADTSLVARRLGSVEAIVVASPAYLEKHGTPEKPQALADHECLIYSGGARDTWQFRSGRKWVSVKPQGRFRADNGEVLRAAALAGLGITALPDFLVNDAFKRGDLVRLLENYPMPAATIQLLRPGGRAPARLQALADHLAAWFGGDHHISSETRASSDMRA